jgi:hypothetical protein
MKVTHATNGMHPVPHAMYKSQYNVLEGMKLYDVAQLSDLISLRQDPLPAERPKQVKSKDTTVPMAVCTDSQNQIQPKHYGLHAQDIMILSDCKASGK